MLKKILSLVMIAAVMMGLLVSVSVAEEAAGENDYYVYTENGKPVTVRSEPGGEVVGTLEVGTKVEATGSLTSNWAVITFRYDMEGIGIGDYPAYVNRRYLIRISPEELQAARAKEEETHTGDVLTDINAEFRTAMEVEPYTITVRPTRVSSWVSMRWIPNETGMIIMNYMATEKLTVLMEMEHYLQVQDPDTGVVGYIHKSLAAR